MNAVFAAASFAACLLAGCGLTPKQLAALDGAICNHVDMPGFKNTTVAVGGSSKAASVHVSPQCQTIITNGGAK